MLTTEIGTQLSTSAMQRFGRVSDRADQYFGCAARRSARAVHGMVKRTAARAGVNAAISPHWLRHAHGSHAIDEGAPLHEVQATLGHAKVTTTSGYLHARPGSSSGLKARSGSVSSMKMRRKEVEMALS